MKVVDILASIDAGTLALPEFQRGYVWTRDQVRGLMQSLYLQYPVGSLLTWKTKATTTQLKGGSDVGENVIDLLLDGQQRMTSLYGVVRGKAPKFFSGNAASFTDLYFDLRTEQFEFFGPVKMKNDPLWVGVTEVFGSGHKYMAKVGSLASVADSDKALYMERISQLLNIANVDLHIEPIIGADKTVDVVVEIFNRVNSGGTKLSKGDLTLARICAQWPDARGVMLDRLAGWRGLGYEFTLDWYLRVATAIHTGKAKFEFLDGVDPVDFENALSRAGKSIDYLLNLVSGRLGLDHHGVLGGRGSFPIMARFVDAQGCKLDLATQQKLLFWYLHSAIWGRHSGSAETIWQQDLDALERDGIDGLIELLRLWRGDLRVLPEHLAGSTRILRTYPLIYLLSRVAGARDFGTGIEIKQGMVGKLAQLDLHHIFPKAYLAKHGYPQNERNALANFCFLLKGTNLAISDSAPDLYLAQVENSQPGALASQWVPTDPDLWNVQNYRKFLARRRELLAAAANEFLDSLLHGTAVPSNVAVEPSAVVRPRDLDDAPVLVEIRELARQFGFAAPEIPYEVIDDATGELIATADAAWPHGLQSGLSQACAFLIESDGELIERFASLGWRCFVSRGELLQHIEELVGEDLDDDGLIGDPAFGTDDVVELDDPPAVRSSGAYVPLAVVDLTLQQDADGCARHRLAFLQGVVDLGVSVTRPSSKRRADEYVNLRPVGSGRRVGTMHLRSGRCVIFGVRTHLAEFDHAEVIYNNERETDALRVYLRGSGAVDDALSLAELALAAVEAGSADPGR